MWRIRLVENAVLSFVKKAPGILQGVHSVVLISNNNFGEGFKLHNFGHF